MRPHTSIDERAICVHQPLPVDERAKVDIEAVHRQTVDGAAAHHLGNTATKPKPETTASHAEADQKKGIPILSPLLRGLGSLAAAAQIQKMPVIRNFHS